MEYINIAPSTYPTTIFFNLVHLRSFINSIYSLSLPPISSFLSLPSSDVTSAPLHGGAAGDMDSSLDGAPAAQTVNIPLLSTKRKRTKRLRPHSPPLPPTTFSPDYLRLSPPSPETSTTDELETAKCLLLLSQGGFSPPITHKTPPAASNSTPLYTCKTCNRTFTSFQALGGHRTSHRKTKTDRKSSAVSAFSDDDDFPSPNSLSLQLSTVPTAVAIKPAPSPRMHECAYCGAEFTSGQALGGHMRKHRGSPMIGRAAYIPIDEIEAEESKRQKSGLPPLDLNLPAPEDENQKLRLGRGLREKGDCEMAVGLSGSAPPPLAPFLFHKV